MTPPSPPVITTAPPRASSCPTSSAHSRMRCASGPRGSPSPMTATWGARGRGVGWRHRTTMPASSRPGSGPAERDGQDLVAGRAGAEVAAVQDQLLDRQLPGRHRHLPGRRRHRSRRDRRARGPGSGARGTVRRSRSRPRCAPRSPARRAGASGRPRPYHRIRTSRREGKAPRPPVGIAKGAWLAATSLIASISRGISVSAVGPMKARVRCHSCGSIQRSSSASADAAACRALERSAQLAVERLADRHADEAAPALVDHRPAHRRGKSRVDDRDQLGRGCGSAARPPGRQSA